MPNAFTETIVQIATSIVGGGTVIPPTVTTAENPAFNDSQEWAIRVLLAFMVGAILNLIVGLVKSEITKHRSK